MSEPLPRKVKVGDLQHDDIVSVLGHQPGMSTLLWYIGKVISANPYYDEIVLAEEEDDRYQRRLEVDRVILLAEAAPPTRHPYDTGEVAEPHIWPQDHDHWRIGKVDFDDDQGRTVATARAVRNDDGSYTLEVTPHDEPFTVTMERN